MRAVLSLCGVPQHAPSPAEPRGGFRAPGAVADSDTASCFSPDTAFAAGNFANAIEAANELDVLGVAINQLKLSDYNPSLILLNPDDLTKIMLLKATTNEYLNSIRNQMVNNQLMGVNYAVSSSITAGEYHIIDAQRYGAFYNRQQVTVEVGYDGSDFSEGQRTARCSQRGALVVFDTGAAVSGTFSTDKASLETA